MTAANPFTGTVYKGGNALALSHAQEWATFLQWTRAGYRIRKGEHGTRIVAVSDNETVTKDAHGKNNRITHVVRHYTVFSAAQVDKV